MDNFLHPAGIFFVTLDPWLSHCYIDYFLGAQKLQGAGGSLRTELLSWHQHLQKCKGLGNLAAFVNKLL